MWRLQLLCIGLVMYCPYHEKHNKVMKVVMHDHNMPLDCEGCDSSELSFPLTVQHSCEGCNGHLLSSM